MAKFEREKKNHRGSKHQTVTVSVGKEEFENFSSNLPTVAEIQQMVLDPEKSYKNTKNLYVGTQLLLLPEINMRDVVEVQQRINDVFMLHAGLNLSPTVAGIALSLNGMTRETFSKIVHDKPLGGNGVKSNLPAEVIDFLKRVYTMLETTLESNMANSNIHPTMGIFLAKNHFGYRDASESIVTHVKEEENMNMSDIRKRYLPVVDVDDEDIETAEDE